MQILNNAKKKALNWLKKYQFYILSWVLFGTAIYFMLMSQELVNCYDGIWWNSHFIAGEWERSIGRWLWPYLDKLRFGVVSVPLNSVLTLLLDATASALLVDLFRVKNKAAAFLIGALFISSPITCDVLSYAYMSPTFGLAFLLSVAACVVLVRTENPTWAVIFSGICIICSMGCYQAYLGVTCVVWVFILLKAILEKEELKNCGFLACRMIGAFFLGGGGLQNCSNCHESFLSYGISGL